jgi:hypothetical protein
MSQIYLEIGDAESMTAFLEEARAKTGLLKDISLDKVEYVLSTKEFPIRVPVNLDAVIELAMNPVVKKMFGKKIEETTKKALLKAIES